MNKTLLGGMLATAFACVALVGCASKPKILSVGENTYTITREARTGFDRDTDSLKAQALQEAQAFCESQGKQLKIVSISSKRPRYWTQDFAKVTVVFKALNPGDPELAAPPPPPPAPALAAGPGAPAEAAPAPAAGGSDFYNELIKLDDLHKRGILTDEEYQAAKKRILDRVN